MTDDGRDEITKARDQRLTEMHSEFVLQIQETREAFRQQLSDLRATFQQQISDLKVMLNERYATQTKAIDTAFKSAEAAVNAALANAEKAVTKAETAADKRFDSVNEFRGLLADQASTFMPRAEYDTAHASLVQRFEAESKRLSDRVIEHENNETRIHAEMLKPHEEMMRAINALDSKSSSRLDILAGKTLGSEEVKTKAASAVSYRMAVYGIIIGFTVVAADVILYLVT